MALLLVGVPLTAQAQMNFKPLDRGEYTEVEDRVLVVKGLEAGGDYAFMLQRLYDPELPGTSTRSRIFQDFRLNLDSAIDREVDMHITLEAVSGQLNDADPRLAPALDNRLDDGMSDMTVQAREAYLRYRFNPRSGLIMGKQEVSIGDRRGKTFDGIVPGATLDCQVKTWCFPFGVFKIGKDDNDFVYHFALTYNAWEDPEDTPENTPKDTLKVEIFRTLYNETNTPLGTNLGPGYKDRNNPAVTPYSINTAVGPQNAQVVDGNGVPMYFDSVNHNYFGLRIDFQNGGFFWNYDVTSDQGSRKYHLYIDPATDQPVGTPSYGTRVVEKNISGVAMETEIGFQGDEVRGGLRAMNATGDKYIAGEGGYLRNMVGYYEISPGTYKGTRYYFNGRDSDVGDGGGLGHSINNTRVVGLFVDWDSPGESRKAFHTGVFKLTRNHPVPIGDPALGVQSTEIGTEWDNMAVFYIHKALQLQLEGNIFYQGPAFSYTDYIVPDGHTQTNVQLIGRFVYHF